MSQRNESPKASIWKAKNDKLAETAPSKGRSAASSKKTTASSSKNQSRGKKSEKKDQRVQYQPKLMTEEDSEVKTCLIKIGMRTSIRQVINFSLEKIRKDWTVTFNAFQQDLTKAMQACEIIKTRVPFLYQENKFISWDVPTKDKDEVTADVADESKKEMKQRVRTGLSITLSKVKFEVTNVAGYQKPKPRQFLQPLPQKTKPVSKIVESDDEHQEEQRQKRGGGKGRRARSAQKVSKVKNEENKENSHPKRRRGGKRKDNVVDERSHSEERRRFSSQDEYHDRRSAPRGYYHGYRDDSRRRFNKGPQHSKNFDSDYEKPTRQGGYGKMMYHHDSDRFLNDYSAPKNRGPMHNRYHDGGFPPSHVPFRERQFKGGPPPNMRGYNNYKGPMSRGSEYDKPDRPGYYAGSMRPFRMDKMRNEPLEREERGPPQLTAKEYRDQRNRPSLNERR